MTKFRRLASAAFAAAVFAALSPPAAHACACGCGVFGVGDSLLPAGSGWKAWVEDDYMNQNRNRHGVHAALAADNEDKKIETNFLTLGAQYMTEGGWGVALEAPYWSRTFDTTDEDSGEPAAYRHSSLGDVRITGTYAGFSPDLSTGITLGVKLPTGDFHTPGFDRDTQIGTGATDLLLGAYHRGPLNRAQRFGYFVQAAWDRPLAYQGGYKPGQEVNLAAGVSYSGWSFGKVMVAPALELLASHRDSDAGAQADPDNSGYDRLLVSPGVQLSGGRWSLYGDVGIPLYQRYRGDQLAAPALFKLVLSRAF